MKKVKVAIADENTLILQEDASKGDEIDLKSIHEADIDKSNIASVINSIKTNEFNSELAKRVEQEAQNLREKLALEAKLKEEQLIQQAKEDLTKKDTYIAALNSKLEAISKQAETEAKLKEEQLIQQAKEALTKKDTDIAALSSKLEAISKQAETDAKLKTLEESQRIEKDYQQKLIDAQTLLKETEHKGELEAQVLKDKLQASETALVSLKEMRTKMSTKMIGESLEIHCENEFNKIRSIAFPNAYFEKDNDASSGSKGDYIYKETDEAGGEILSIMFEMKNEADETATKHKNKDFFKELDKDRREKGCEFAVLVSLLEKDNEYYDDITTVYEYKNMYCIRPQHFITIISFLRQGNLRSLAFQKQVQTLQNQNIDVTNFENEMHKFKEGFSRNYDLASKQFGSAIEEIDKAIDRLNKVKENLTKSDNNLRIANNKAEDLSIKRLTKNSPSVREAFEAAAENQD